MSDNQQPSTVPSVQPLSDAKQAEPRLWDQQWDAADKHEYRVWVSHDGMAMGLMAGGYAYMASMEHWQQLAQGCAPMALLEAERAARELDYQGAQSIIADHQDYIRRMEEAHQATAQELERVEAEAAALRKELRWQAESTASESAHWRGLDVLDSTTAGRDLLAELEALRARLANIHAGWGQVLDVLTPMRAEISPYALDAIAAFNAFMGRAQESSH